MAGGGRKRGRTQRRHFSQGRENVWKHSKNDANSNANDSAGNKDLAGENPNTSWEPFATQNSAFDEYYKEQGIVSEAEWEEFILTLRKPLPAAFRINSSCLFSHDIHSQLKHDFIEALEAEVSNEAEAIKPLPWYPGNLAWQLNFSRMQLRKNQTLERFHEFLKEENEVGNITRQEAVSMVPPLFLDVLPDHYILDMCAAPGSKTFQLLEMMHQSDGIGLLPKGLVIANDVDVQRCNLLIHQTKRMCSANLIVTNHEAQHFPRCSLSNCNLENIDGQVMKTGVLEFDRVLCDVPCSGDGTLRKAPDIWRKWNAGMGNGVHRLQVEIAMRGLALLKLGGRMVYSTCSMNPVENEAVVAELLRRTGGSVELLDVSNELPSLVRRAGLKTWKVRDKGSWVASYADVAKYRRGAIIPSMFPSGRSCNENQIICDHTETEVKLVDPSGETNLEANGESVGDLGSNVRLDSTTNGSDLMQEVSPSPAMQDLGEKFEDLSFPLERCMRIVPHDQNTGAFFIAVLRKISPLPVLSKNEMSQVTSNIEEVPSKSRNPLEVEVKSERVQLLEPSNQKDNVLVEESSSDVNVHQSSKNDSIVEFTADPTDLSSKSIELEEVKPSTDAGSEGAKHRVQVQGRWKGVDPVVFFRDEAIISSIRSFYGINQSFPLSGHLVTRNSDPNHVKRIYYVSNSVHEILDLNLQVGQRLKIASLGLKTFERQTSKEGSTCAFRLSSEGLPLLLPHIGKQILFASLVDFQHLLKYRSIKIADFVNPGFGDKVSSLMLGCCVIVLDAGDKNSSGGVVDSSSIGIVCWRGKNSVSIMVSQLDAKELLQRLLVRFGDEQNIDHMVTDGDDAKCSADSEPDATVEDQPLSGDEPPMEGGECLDVKASD